ncbi:HET multi-domain protein [Pyrenophora tritici-repentis]|nr:HET multi-domain protein [Pyrenophora tritici-repentis]
MRIYLCQVRERTDGSLYIERNREASTEHDYIAISHVWGSPDTIQAVKVDGIDEPVSLSPGKFDILTILRRPDVCGDTWFWMDLFCLDQSPNATIPMSDQLASIPTIYKRSRCVKVLIESPICRDWTATVAQADTRQTDPDTFEELELHHARKCRLMLFADPWFDRLWTRQEGLYAMKLQTVLLNLKDCPRYRTNLGDIDKWVSEGENADQREAVYTFLYDKLQYHGNIKPDSGTKFQAYLDLAYRGELDMKNYQTISAGEKSLYSPIDSAWRSGRTTTKARDYVLAVFPDLEGYTVPTDARKLSFAELLEDALQQLQHSKHSAKAAAKVTKGTVETNDIADTSIQPFIPATPANITEAYDTFHLLKRLPALDPTPQKPLTCSGENLHVIAQNLTLTTTIPLTKPNLADLVALWESSANITSQLLACPQSSPATATRVLKSEQDLCYRSFALSFCQSTVRKWAVEKNLPHGFVHGVVDADKLTGVTEQQYGVYLARFMVCLMCGVSLRNAVGMLERCEFRVLVTEEGGRVLALVNKGVLEDGGARGLVLLSRGMSDVEGLHVGVEREGGCVVVVGRTWIPKEGIFEM